MSVTSALARRDAGDGEDDRHRQLERLEVEMPGGPRRRSDSEPTFTTKKNTGMISAGMIASGSRGICRSARMATEVRSRAKPACRAITSSACGSGRTVAVGGVMLHLRLLVAVGPDSRSASRAPVTDRNTSSSVGVRSDSSRTAHLRAPARAMATGLIAAGPLLTARGHLVAVDVDALDAGDARRSAGRAISGSPSTTAMTRSVPMRPLQLVGRALGDDAAVVDDPDAVGELVGLLEVLRGEEDGHAELAVEPPHLVPHARRG